MGREGEGGREMEMKMKWIEEMGRRCDDAVVQYQVTGGGPPSQPPVTGWWVWVVVTAGGEGVRKRALSVTGLRWLVVQMK
jgi:hypothetical protein